MLIKQTKSMKMEKRRMKQNKKMAQKQSIHQEKTIVQKRQSQREPLPNVEVFKSGWMRIITLDRSVFCSEATL